MESKRIGYIDLIKTFTIFCVLWGHCIQQLDNNLIPPWKNPVISYIYSFHMPLFYLLSGFFFKSSLKYGLKDFLVRKGVQLILPYLVWCVLRGALLLVYSVIVKGNTLTLPQSVKTVFYGHFWFLRELFISYCIAYAGYRIFRKGFTAAILCICFTLFAPLMSSQSFYLPIFFAGIFIKEYYTFFKRHAVFILAVSSVLFGVCLPYWKGEYYGVFLKLYSWRTFEFNFSNAVKCVCRIITGISGSIFFLALFNKIYKENVISKYFGKYGKYTLEIYILQVIIIETVITRVIDFPNINIWVYSLAVTPVISVFVFALCIVIIRIIERNRIANLILFGRKMM
jgi:fucose 4-O-acetylase-like acetyltransferase